MMQPTIALDSALFQTINAHHLALLDAVFFVITQFGNGWVVIPLFAALIVIRYRGRIGELRNVLVVCAVSLIIASLVNNGVKLLADRPRPIDYCSQQQTPCQVHVLGPSLHAHSMPSGHTNTAFAVATLCVIFFGLRWWPGFVVAALVAYSRVYVGAHFPADTVVGAALGVGVVYAVILVSRGIGRQQVDHAGSVS
jgi:undecaprenyl-diphosphatase